MTEQPSLRTIGVICCSFPGAALCIESICRESERIAGRHHNPPIAMHMLNFSDHVACVATRNYPGLGRMVVESAHALAAAGADLLICPDNTAHLGLVNPVLPLPFIHIAEPVAAKATHGGIKRLGLLGTEPLVRSGMYTEVLAKSNIEVCLATDDQIQTLDAYIFGELTRGIVSEPARVLTRSIADHFQRLGCEALVLGCTELPLLFCGQSLTDLPLLDSSELLAHAAVRAAMGTLDGRFA